ncbi:MAG: hypothetical protein MJ003_02935 [Paludibacteraceae bacterium]|nr:hypothetical protein [Paludibacteraceae bacterium]
MLYFVTVIILLISLFIYFPIARKYKILAGVNNRSSHKHPVITAAGFIFYLSYLIYVIASVASGKEIGWFWFAGLTILAVVSFIDDLKDLWFLVRLFAQVIAIGLMLFQLSLQFQIELGPSVSQWSASILLLMVCVGLVNMYNFMDGLNGMLGGVALSMSVPLLLINKYVPTAIGFADEGLLLMTIIGVCIFLFFNFRKEPLCFSGDVGSIVLGYMMTYFVISLVIKTGNVAYFLLFAIVMMEAGLTIVQRLFAGENIFAPHRIHLFQLYCNEFYKSHLLVSGIYSGIQLGFGMALFLMNYYKMSVVVQNCILWPMFAILCVVYLLLKRKKMGGHLLTKTTI